MAVTHEINCVTLAGLGFPALTLGCGMVGLYTSSASKSAVMEQRLGEVEKTADLLTKGVQLSRTDFITSDERTKALDARTTEMQRRFEMALDRVMASIEGLRSERRRA